MNLLLYGIFIPNKEIGFPSLSGVGGQPLIEIRDRGLAAAVSKTAPNPPTDISALMTYEKVVAALHRSSNIDGVIPMRYGSMALDRSQVHILLRERRKEYRSLLQEIEGCEEMGIRLLLPSGTGGKKRAGTGDATEVANGSQQFSSGRAYLETRRNSYEKQDMHIGEKEIIVDQCRVAFAQVSRCLRSEHRVVRDPRSEQLHILISLYFLVPRPLLPDFCRKASEIRQLLPCRLLLSGPWPPFNFALTETTSIATPLEAKLSGGIF